MSENIVCISNDNISLAWAEAFRAVYPRNDVSPLLVEITDLSNESIKESMEIKEVLESHLASQKRKYSCDTVANTIFPRGLWNRTQDRHFLYSKYQEIYKNALSKVRFNAKGTYFQRLVMYDDNGKSVNQLEHIIETWHRGNRRRSAFMTSIFNPFRDHTHQPRMGFPCIHQVSFIPRGQNGKKGLVVTAKIPRHYIFDRAYGNYLGLIRLGQFMAHEMHLKLSKVIVFAGVASTSGDCSKKSLRPLFDGLCNLIDE